MPVYEVKLQSLNEWTFIVRASSQKVAEELAYNLLSRECEMSISFSEEFQNDVFDEAVIKHTKIMLPGHYSEDNIDAVEEEDDEFVHQLE